MRFTILLLLSITLFSLNPVNITFSQSIPDDAQALEGTFKIPYKNSPQFWIWNDNKKLIYGSSDPDTEIIYLASLTKAYTLNKFIENETLEVTIAHNTPYNYSKVQVGDTLSYVDAITAILARSCNTVAENMLDSPPKEGFISSSGLPAYIDGVRYENKDTPTNVLKAFAKNELLIEIYAKIYDGRFGRTTYRKWTAYDDLYFNFIKTGFTDQAGKCVFIKTNNHYFLFVGWEQHSKLVKDSIAMVRIFEEDHTPTDLKTLGSMIIQ